MLVPVESHQWRIECFGGLRAVRGDIAMERFRTRRGAVLLAFLACYPDRVHTRDALAEMLWPDAPPGVGRDRLKNELSALRRQFAFDSDAAAATASVLRTAGQNGVALGIGAISDVAEFEAALRTAQTVTSPETRIQLLSRAADLCSRGDLLPDFDEEWILADRERLRELRLDTLCRLSAALLAAARTAKARQYAEEALRAFPDREESATVALRAALAEGDTVGARRLFETFATRFRTTWGAEPPATLRTLIADAGAAAEPSPLPSPSTAPKSSVELPVPPAPTATMSDPTVESTLHSPRHAALPRALTRFFGRTDEVARVAGWASGEPGIGGAGRLLTVTGPGGVGKTRLSLEVATLVAQLPGGAAPEPVIFVPLEDATTLQQFQDALLTAVGGAYEGIRPLEEVVASLPRPFLVLDNFEQIAESVAGPLADLLAQCPRLRCLVTSRRLLEIAGEEELPLGPLPMPASDEAFPQLASRDSVRLFADRARLARADFALTPRTAPAVADVCRLLEGVPLAIELAAARSLVLGPAQMREQLTDRFAFLISRRRDLPERHRSLRAAIEWSIGLLTPSLRHVFARLSVFRGGFTLEAAEAACGGKTGTLLDDLERLRSDSLIRADLPDDTTAAAATRFSLLESLRLYGDELLAPDERAATRRRHAEFYAAQVAEAAAADGAGWGRPAVHRLALFDTEEENLRAALGWWEGEGPRQPARLLRFVCALEPCWFARGRFAAGEAACLGAIAATAEAGDTPERGDVHVCASTFVRSRGDHASADRLLTEAGRIYTATEDKGGAAEALAERGYVALRIRDFASAGGLLENALHLFETLGDMLGAASARNLLGLVALGKGQTSIGMALLQDSLSTFDAAGDARSAAYAAHDLGAAELRRAGGNIDLPAAEAWLTRSLRYFSTRKEGQGIAFCLEGFAAAAVQRQDWQRAATLHAAADHLRETLGLPLPPYDAPYRDTALITIQAALSPAAFDTAQSEGESLSIEEATALALRQP